MRRPPEQVRGRLRRGAGTTGSRHLSLSATDAEWDVVRRNAQARGLSIARYLVGLVERGGVEEAATVALTRDEQRELLRSVREVRALMLGQEVPEEADPARPAPPEAAPPEAKPERTEPEDPGDGEVERLRREIRDWPGRAEALIAGTPGRNAPLAARTERRLRVEAMLAEGRAMEAAGSPHAPHLETMPEEAAALAKAVSRLANKVVAVELLEAEALHRNTEAFARETGGIAFDAPNYGALRERLRSFGTPRGLGRERYEPIRALIARDARWRRDRKRVADFLGRARAAVRARGDLEEDIRALHEPSGSAPPEQVPRIKSGAGSGRQGQAPDRGPGQAPDWRAEAEGVLRESTALVDAMPARELGAHLVAAGATLEELGELAARLRAMLARGGT